MQQQFGTIETEQGLADAMLCIDQDRPDEAMIHWWRSSDFNSAQAMLVKLNLKTKNNYSLNVLNIYKTNDAGGLYLPKLSAEEIENINKHSATLCQVKTSFKGSWQHSSGKGGGIHFEPIQITTKLVPKVCDTWEAFKKLASKVRKHNDVFLFRGHGSNKYHLETTLSRAGRNRVMRYCDEILTEFRSEAEAVLSTRIDLENGDDYAMLLGLAQHHGLPTPLLDWTRSPYIAAFFAFSEALESFDLQKGKGSVRIYGLTREFVEAGSPRKVTLPYYKPYVFHLRVSPRNNARLQAQQGHFLVTNVVNIEAHLHKLEKQADVKILSAIDMPIRCAVEALKDLEFMGITAATLFPGLDGVCRKMKQDMILSKILRSNFA